MAAAEAMVAEAAARRAVKANILEDVVKVVGKL
jgi:hypothetical protein